MPFGVSHRIIRRIARWTVISFFSEIEVIGEENVPKTGPIIIACNHHNMIVDPVMLSVTCPHQRMLHYWAKSTLFKNPIANRVLLDAGCVPVDRRSKDNQVLFKGTFEALASGEAVAVFPEGTSYTEPRIMQVKDGVSWSALEYTKWLQTPEGRKGAGKEVVIVPAGIVYTNKSKYRSRAVIEFGPPITMAQYQDEFLANTEGSARTAVKRLTLSVEQQMTQLTVNAPDWETVYAAKMARELLWPGENSVPLHQFVTISQTLVDLFADCPTFRTYATAKSHLVAYHALLTTTGLTNSSLSTLPLPRVLDPAHPAPLPSRLLTLGVLLRDTLGFLVRLPFFAIPLLLHFPAYVLAKIGAGMVEDEEETQAQNKIVFGLLFLIILYPTLFYFLWALLRLTTIAALFAACTVWWFAVYHNRLIDDNYERAKRLIAAWRVLIGVWGPKRWDLGAAALKPYMKPRTPPPSPWVSKPTDANPSIASTAAPQLQPDGHQKRRRPASRRMIRHVLRARLDAARSLATFLGEVERSGSMLRASAHLALMFRGRVDDDNSGMEAEPTDNHVPTPSKRTGWRSAREVVGFLRARGARIATLVQSADADWAVASSEGEDEGGSTE
ncbi:hypothetical protein BOTBODRAFT_120414 [Botryobasidium botryosum FD-172 SS1]|uniref:Phospholipid/glycerol acyltransferase domain-containing protein n=1 Tax=Botryobasidium botryosum (strain FD-172 SS1) TaxID=930990 RepID=A0A067LXU0_BOTB1|nr:hypothetical protein BOTBODRAFT_120414 [Botryobasidium botryosum FD-172 SS1]